MKGLGEALMVNRPPPKRWLSNPIRVRPLDRRHDLLLA